MTAWAVVVITVLGTVLGAIAGVYWGEHLDRKSGSDWPFSPIITVPVGALIGTFVGLIAALVAGV